MRSLTFWLVLAATSVAVAAQDRSPIPPIPRQEQFVARKDLRATVRVSPSAVTVGQKMKMWVVMENVGTKPLRVPDPTAAMTRLVSTTTRREMLISLCYVTDSISISRPISVRNRRVLAPQQKLEEEIFEYSCRWGEVPPLPIDTYEVHVTLVNAADSPHVYDVYERGADEVWEGTLTLAPVSLTVIPSEISSAGADRRTKTAAQLSQWGGAAPSPFTEPPASVSVEVRPQAVHLDTYLKTTLADGDEEDRSLALRGITRFGQKSMFSPLRQALDANNEETQYRVGIAMAALTFTDQSRGQFTSPIYWDAWWNRHGGQSREQWAREVLVRLNRRGQPFRESELPASKAAEYLVTSRGGDEQVIRDLSQHRSWRVRLAAADALASFNQRYAGELMLRELHNRYVAACESASGLLSQLTRIAYAFECLDPAARQRAIAHWRSAIDRLPNAPPPIDAPSPADADRPR